MIPVSLSDRDWGRVAGALEHALGFERRIRDTAAGLYPDAAMGVELRIANLVRIKQSIVRQRKEATGPLPVGHL